MLSEWILSYKGILAKVAREYLVDEVAKLERVALETRELVEKMDDFGVSCVGGYFVDDIREALADAKHLLESE